MDYSTNVISIVANEHDMCSVLRSMADNILSSEFGEYSDIDSSSIAASGTSKELFDLIEYGVEGYAPAAFCAEDKCCDVPALTRLSSQNGFRILTVVFDCSGMPCVQGVSDFASNLPKGEYAFCYYNAGEFDGYSDVNEIIENVKGERRALDDWSDFADKEDLRERHESLQQAGISQITDSLELAVASAVLACPEEILEGDSFEW